LEEKRKVRRNVQGGKKLKSILRLEPKNRYVAVDFDDAIIRFAKSDEDSVEIQNTDEKLKSMLKARMIALKKAKKVENVKVVSRMEKGRLVELWLVKK